jgi:hypothetical protein
LHRQAGRTGSGDRHAVRQQARDLLGARDERIIDHTCHRELKIMHGYARQAELVSESLVKQLGL